MMDGYSTSKYTEDMFISPPSHCGSNISVSHDPPDYKVRAGRGNISLALISDHHIYFSISAAVSAPAMTVTEDTTATPQVSLMVVLVGW